jgi:hypothetical protein
MRPGRAFERHPLIAVGSIRASRRRHLTQSVEDVQIAEVEPAICRDQWQDVESHELRAAQFPGSLELRPLLATVCGFI